MKGLWNFIFQLLTVDGGVSSKRFAGLILAFYYAIMVFIMALRKDYSLVSETGYLAGALLGLGILDKLFKSK